MHEAKTQLSRLLDLVEQGESVTIARHGKPVAELAPIRKKGFPFDIAKGHSPVPPGDEWWAPMTDEEYEDWISGR